MKKFCISLVCLSIIILTIALVSQAGGVNEEYLRIHIRANSNADCDQSVKLDVRDAVVEYLTPVIANSACRDELEKSLKCRKNDIKSVAERVLEDKGYAYGASVKVTAEQFPTRVYGQLTLEAGIYDALIIELGSGEGDNWWCVVYPPLCFTGGGGKFAYKSRILEIIAEWRERK